MGLAPAPMIELIASLVVDLSEQHLIAYDHNDSIMRVIPVSTGKASTPTPIFDTKVFTKYRSVTMRGRNYTVPGVPYTMCVSANEAHCLHEAPWQENAGEPFGVPRSNGCVRMPLEQARWLFHNTPTGTPVRIRA